VKSNLSTLKAALSAVEAGLVETLDCVVFAISSESFVDDAISSYAYDRHELECAIINNLAG
jgi:hypothetical protein